MGEVLGKYHPHGDMAVYDCDGSVSTGFFSTIHAGLKDREILEASMAIPPAAMRYTEARLTEISMDILQQLGDGPRLILLRILDGSLEEP